MQRPGWLWLWGGGGGGGWHFRPGCARCGAGSQLGGGSGPSPQGVGLYQGDDGNVYGLGIPIWGVLEPYISVQLRDIPVSYSPSRGADIAVKMCLLSKIYG